MSPLAADPYELLKMSPIQFYDLLVFSHQNNPTPFHKRLTGDFYYIQLRTLENHDYHISAGPQGFQPTNLNGIGGQSYFYNLIDLLQFLSPKFK